MKSLGWKGNEAVLATPSGQFINITIKSELTSIYYERVVNLLTLQSKVS